MKITKSLTTEICAELVKPLTDQINNLREEFKNIAIKYHLSTIPKQVLDIYNEGGDIAKWLNKRSYFTVRYKGDYYDIKLDKSLPNNDNSSYIYINDPKVEEELFEIQQKICKATNKRNGLIDELEATILKLGTYAKVKEQFPEAAKFLPEENKASVGLALNISDIQKKLQNLP